MDITHFRHAIRNRSSAALTRVCRQIRFEYRKMHAQASRIRLRVEDLPFWLDTASTEYPPAKEVHIVVTRGTFASQHPVDILRLLRLNDRFADEMIFRFEAAQERPLARFVNRYSREFRIFCSGVHLPTLTVVVVDWLNVLLGHTNATWLSILRGHDKKRVLKHAYVWVSQCTLELVFGGRTRPQRRELGLGSNPWSARMIYAYGRRERNFVWISSMEGPPSGGSDADITD